MRLQLSILKNEHDRKVDELVAGVRLKHLVPFCDRHALQFGTWNGDWAFLQSSGGRAELNEVPDFPGSEALSELLHISVNAHNDVGSLMAGYIGKNYDRAHPALELSRALGTRKGAKTAA